MNKNINLSKVVLEDYLNLVKFVEQETERMQNLHTKHITCKKGCSSCCLSFRIFSVEKDIIYKTLLENDIALPLHNENTETTCKYLVNGDCSIYQYRPIMCRTHGFPLLYLNEDEDAYEFSGCELNFSTIDMSEVVIENCIMMDDINKKLFTINETYLADNKIVPNEDELLCNW
ncbi:MAG: YkgJ family cysteine cluster protein [Bacteroidales bacterium]|nr:YkgJ family cysteine cluster protein [Bacteroidales bacterium]